MGCTKFDPDTAIPDLKDKVVLVTGGNAGIGKETIIQLARHNPALILLGARSQQKADTAITEIRAALGEAHAPTIEFLNLDLANFTNIKSAASQVLQRTTRLDLLVNNAGVMALPPGLTADGYEIQFGTNHMGHALLTRLLLPLLQYTSTLIGADVRVVTLSSNAENFAPAQGILFDRVKSDMSEASTWTRYGQSKLSNIHYTRALASKYPTVKFHCVHPGVVRTNLMDSYTGDMNRVFGIVVSAASWVAQVPVSKGALNSLWALSSPEAKTGVFYYPIGVTGKDSKLACDTHLTEALWEFTEREITAFL